MNNDPLPEQIEEQASASNILVKSGQIVKYIDSDTGNRCVTEIIGRARKVTGMNKNWYNLRYSEPKLLKEAEISADLSKVEKL